MRKKISVVVPVYKVEQYLERCIESIVNQTYSDLEIILVDDGSPDSSPQICDKWAEIDSRVMVIHKQNGGLSDARNAGLDAVTSEFVLFVDSDDYIELDACEKLLNTIITTDADFVVGVAKNIDGKKISYQRKTKIKNNIPIQSDKFIIEAIRNGEWYAPAWLNLYRVDFLNINNLRFVKNIIHEDIEFLPRLYLSAKIIAYCDYPFYNYIIRDNSIMTSTISKKRVDDTLKIYFLWKQQFDSITKDDLRIALYGNLIKQYLFSCRALGIIKWEISGIDFNFGLKYALSKKDKLKVIFFNFFPNQYVGKNTLLRIKGIL